MDGLTLQHAQGDADSREPAFHCQSLLSSSETRDWPAGVVLTALSITISRALIVLS